MSLEKCIICGGTEEHQEKCFVWKLIQKVEKRCDVIKDELRQEISDFFNGIDCNDR